MSLISELKRRNVLRVAAAYTVSSWVIIQVAETIMPFFGFSDMAIRNIIMLLAIGLFPTVIISWAFQLTPEGIQRDSGDSKLESDASAVRNLDRAIIVLLVVGISYFAFDKFVLAPERAAEREAAVAEQAKAEAVAGYYGERSIAVLSFENLSADPGQQYLVDGVAEELLNHLAKIRQLRVISRSSSFALRDLDLEVPEIAERLDVAHVLQGSVRRAGNTVRVTVQLIEARTITHLWSKTYERQLENVFSIQDEIAADIARNLELNLLSPLPSSRFVDPMAIALTQQAKQISERRPHDVGERMSPLIERAIEIDPTYVTAWQWKISADIFLQREGLISTAERERRYKESRRRILGLEPDSAFIDSLDGYDAMRSEKFEDAAASFERALSKDASRSSGVRIAGMFAREIGKFDTAMRLGEHSVAIDPLCYMCLYQLSRTYMYAGNIEAAAEIRRRYMVLGEGGRFHFGVMLLLQGESSQALEHFQDFDSTNLQKYAGLSMAHHDLGDFGQAEDALKQLMSMSGGDLELLVAEAAAWMGKRDIAFEWLKTASNKRPAGSLSLMNPAFRNLHGDARWNEFLGTVGFSPERLDAIDFDPALPM